MVCQNLSTPLCSKLPQSRPLAITLSELFTMKKFIIISIPLMLLHAGLCHAQSLFKMLHYTETSGYDHHTRQNSLSMFQSLGADHNFEVDNDTDGAAFNSLSMLEQYAVIVFSNTSGDNLLDATQRMNLETYINNGGSLLGIHAASDTYRHSTANGSNTGTWDWYAETLGASVQENPNHVSGTPAYDMTFIGSHYTTANLPNPWNKNEEYYYWENGYYHPDNIAVLEVEATLGPNGLVNSYDSARPISWYRLLPGGGRVFYTALGHSANDFVNDQHFITHVRDALLWTADFTATSSLHPTEHPEMMIHHPAGSSIHFTIHSSGKGSCQVVLYDVQGKIVYQETACSQQTETKQIMLDHLNDGMYLLQLQYAGGAFTRKIFCNKTN